MEKRIEIERSNPLGKIRVRYAVHSVQSRKRYKQGDKTAHTRHTTHTTNTKRYSIITKSHSTEQTQTNTEREAHNRSSVTNLHQEDFEPFYVISLILDVSLMQGAQPPYLN